MFFSPSKPHYLHHDTIADGLKDARFDNLNLVTDRCCSKNEYIDRMLKINYSA